MRVEFRPNSLTLRVLGLSSLWSLVAIAVIATVISALFRQASERNFAQLLSAQLYNLINSVDIDETGRLVGAPDLGDIRFSIPESGWYWLVEPLSEERGSLRSPSLGLAELPPPAASAVPFDESYRRTYIADGPGGEKVRVLETEVVLGDPGWPTRFRVSGNQTQIEQEARAFTRRLAFYLGLFGLGSVAVNALVILYGLKPLDSVRRSLNRIRQGRETRLTGRFPAEVAPLANELNALLEGNRRIVERSRTQVGNLAHSLKTPLAVLLNESSAIDGARARLIRDQVRAMEEQVKHYLNRARIAAEYGGAFARTPVAPAVERLLRVMRKLNPEIEIEASVVDAQLAFAGEAQDLEEVIGNLLENAAKYADRKVALSVAAQPAPEAARQWWLLLAVDDDGPGIAEDAFNEALQRGKRLDETRSGSGLGLSIVQETAQAYGGRVRRAESRLGGLRVEVLLPAVQPPE